MDNRPEFRRRVVESRSSQSIPTRSHRALPPIVPEISCCANHRIASTALGLHFTVILPIIFGCTEQKYSYLPRALNVNENFSSVSSACDLNL